MTSPDCVTAGLGIDVIEAEDVPNVRDLFEIFWTDGMRKECAAASIRRESSGRYYMDDSTHEAYAIYRAGYRAAGGQGA